MNGSNGRYSNEIIRYTFNIDSSQRSSGENTDYEIALTQPIVPLSKYGQFIVSVSSISVPFSFYQLSATDNLNVLPVYLKNALDPTGKTVDITFAPGNYTPYTLITQLNSLLVTACQTASTGFTPFIPTFNTTYSPTTGHITFALTGPASSEIRLLFNTSATTAVLGGFFGVGGLAVIMTPTTTPSSVRPCLLNPVNYLFLRSSLKQYRNREFIVQKDDISDILYRVPIATSQGTWIQYSEPSEPVYIIDTSISTINFYLTTNLSYTAINLQGLSWSFAFSISEVLRPDYVPITEALASNKLTRLSMEERDAMMAELEALKQRELTRLQKYKEKLTKGKGETEPPAEDLKAAIPETSPVGLQPPPGRLLDYTPTAPYGSIFDMPASRPEDPVFQETST